MNIRYCLRLKVYKLENYLRKRVLSGYIGVIELLIPIHIFHILIVLHKLFNYEILRAFILSYFSECNASRSGIYWVYNASKRSELADIFFHATIIR